MMARRRFVSGVLLGMTVFGVSACSEYEKPRKGWDDLSHPDNGPPHLTDDQKIKLIESMRAKGSFEAARDRFTTTAQTIAEQISTAISGQTWKFADDSNAQDDYQNGSLCDKLDPYIARRPRARTVEFGRRFRRMASRLPPTLSARRLRNTVRPPRVRCSTSLPSVTTTCRARAMNSTLARSISPRFSLRATVSCYRA